MDVKLQVASWRWGWRSESLYQESMSSRWRRSGWFSIPCPPFLLQRDRRNEWVVFNSPVNICLCVWVGSLLRTLKKKKKKGSSRRGQVQPWCVSFLCQTLSQRAILKIGSSEQMSKNQFALNEVLIRSSNGMFDRSRPTIFATFQNQNSKQSCLFWFFTQLLHFLCVHPSATPRCTSASDPVNITSVASLIFIQHCLCVWSLLNM